MQFVPGVAIWRGAGRAAERMPATRDRVVDFLRVSSLLTVVFGHMLMLVLLWGDHGVDDVNVLGRIRELRIATWFLQVIPLFFAVAAIANRQSYERSLMRGDPWRVWLWHRMERVIRPVTYYFAIWFALSFAFATFDAELGKDLGHLGTQLVWFLGAYVLVVSATPWHVRLARYGAPGVVGLLALVALVDLARFHVSNTVGSLNFVLVFFLAATYGLVMYDWRDRGAAGFAVTALGALALNVALVRVFPYPISLVSMSDDRVSNMTPPTVVLALHAIALVSIAGIAWPLLTRLCARAWLWRALVAAGAATITIYLWHMTAIVLVTAGEHAVGLERGGVRHFHFWLTLAPHVLTMTVGVAVLVSLMTPFEHRPVPWLEREPRRGVDGIAGDVVAGMGVVATGLGFLVIAAVGLTPLFHFARYKGVPLAPAMGLVFLGGGVLLMRAAGIRSPHG